MIYWDNNATTQPAPEVVEAMLPYLQEFFFNPSAAYGSAKQVHRAIEEAREHVAALVGAHPAEIIFTGGGTEASNTALAQFSCVLTLATEHPSTLRAVQDRGTLCGVLPNGRADVTAWESLLPGHDGSSFAWANHETGVLQPVDDLCAAAERAGVGVHLDLVQAAGKLPLHLHEYPAVSYASLSAHKLHGPKGVGALYVRTGAPFSPLLRGGHQEDARRAGTENVPGIIGFGKAAELALAAVDEYARLAHVREIFLATLREQGVIAVQNGGDAPRLPHVLNMRVPGCTAEALSLLLEPAGLLCSAGSACTSADPHPSHILQAMGLSTSEIRESLRLSWNRYTTESVAVEAAHIFIDAVQKLRSVQSAATGNVMVYIP